MPISAQGMDSVAVEPAVPFEPMVDVITDAVGLGELLEQFADRAWPEIVEVFNKALMTLASGF